jgi:hypothetical protein
MTSLPRIVTHCCQKPPPSGIREQYYLLQTLIENHVKCFSIADFFREVDKLGSLPLPRRHRSSGSDRSIVFEGHAQSTAAMAMHARMRDYVSGLLAAIEDNRHEVHAIHRKLTGTGQPFFSRNIADTLLPAVGVRYSVRPDMYAEIEAPDRALSLSEVASMFERALVTRNRPLFRQPWVQFKRHHQSLPRQRVIFKPSIGTSSQVRPDWT